MSDTMNVHTLVSFIVIEFIWFQLVPYFQHNTDDIKFHYEHVIICKELA